MAKQTLNLSDLKDTLATNMSSKIAQGFTPTYNDYCKLIMKCGEIVDYSNPMKAQLTELDGVGGAGYTEEMFLNLPDVSSYTDTDTAIVGGNTRTDESENFGKPYYLKPEDTYYSYPMDVLKVKVTEPLSAFKGFTSNPAEVVSRILGKAIDSKTLSRNLMKRELIGQYIDHIETASATHSNLIEVLDYDPIASDTNGEAFIERLQQISREAQWENDNNFLQVLQGGTNELVMFVKGTELMSSLRVKTMAGAINREDLNVGNIKIVEVKDFGSYDGDVFAILCDPRAMKLSNVWEETLSGVNEDSATINTIYHYQDKAFYSNVTFAKVFKVDKGE